MKNLVFHNVEVVALDRAGLLAGESNNEKVTVKNITAIDCRVFSGNDDTLENEIYAALIIGRARVETEIQNIKVVSSEVLVKGKYVGGLLGYAEKKVDMSDIDAEIKVTEISTSTTAQLVGGIVGRVRSSGVLTLNRVIAKVDLTGWKNIGGLLGKNEGTAYVYDAVITGELKLLEDSSSKDLGAISGNKSFDETVNVWAVAVIGEGTGGNKQSAPEDKTLGSLEDVADSAWWQENMPNIAESELWDVTGGFAELVREFAIHTVSFVAEGVEIAPRLVLANTKVVLPVPEKAGFEFVGWFIDENHETPFDPETLITEDLTLYGKFEEIPLPTYKVSFDTDVGSEVEE